MTRKQLQFLISAGAFSAALLSGSAYAEDKAAATSPDHAVSTFTVTTPSGTVKSSDLPAQDDKKKSSKKKGFAQHGCAGANGCGSDSK